MSREPPTEGKNEMLTELQNEIVEALAPHIETRHVEAVPYDDAVWVQVNEKYALVEPMEPSRNNRARSYKITTGYEAGFDLAGGEKIEPKVGYVGGIRFGMIPHVLRWVDYHGKARPVKN